MKSNAPFSIILLTLTASFIGLSSCINLNCEFKIDTILKQPLNFCYAQNHLNITDPNTEISKINGNPLTIKSANHITGLSIENKKMQYLPSNLGGKFTNLIALRVKNGRLKELIQEDLKTLPKLRYLNLDDNDIETLDNNVFDFNDKLELIWFSKNKISSIELTVFDGLKSLGNLDLLGNKCISKRVSFVKAIPPFLEIIKENCSNLESTTKTKDRGQFSGFLEVDYGDSSEEFIKTTTTAAPIPTRHARINLKPTKGSDIFAQLKAKAEEELRQSQQNSQNLQNKLNKIDQNSTKHPELENSKQEIYNLKKQLDEQMRSANKSKINHENEIRNLKNQLTMKDQIIKQLEMELKSCKENTLDNGFKSSKDNFEASIDEIEYY